MSLFTNLEFNSLDDLLISQLEDLYDAENRIVKALPKMVEAASSPSLRQAFQNHLEETRSHVERLKRVFRQLGREPEGHTCDAMKGLLSEGDDVISAEGNVDVRDAALIAAAQRVEHYEIAGYGAARSFALRLGHTDTAQLLQETLQEEKEADEKLNQIAESEVNERAAALHPVS